MVLARARWQEIKYTYAKESRAYINHCQRRIYLDCVMKMDPPQVIEDFTVHGTLCLSNNCAIVVEISDDGERARCTTCY